MGCHCGRVEARVGERTANAATTTATAELKDFILAGVSHEQRDLLLLSTVQCVCVCVFKVTRASRHGWVGKISPNPKSGTCPLSSNCMSRPKLLDILTD
jgi:hypothetical protein